MAIQSIQCLTRGPSSYLVVQVVIVSGSISRPSHEVVTEMRSRRGVPVDEIVKIVVLGGSCRGLVDAVPLSHAAIQHTAQLGVQIRPIMAGSIGTGSLIYMLVDRYFVPAVTPLVDRFGRT